MNKALQQLFQNLNLSYLENWIELIISGIQVLLILIIAVIIKIVSNKLLKALENHLRANSPSIEEKKRVKTLARVSNYIVALLIWVIAIMLALSALGFSIAPILATAGVAGIAVGFGAQSLVKDYFTGFVMLIENQIREGDAVELGGKTGLVEEVTLRYVRLRDYEGAVHYIPNSQITLVTNKSRTFAYAVMDIGVAYKENLDHVYEVIRRVGDELKNDLVWQKHILEVIEIAGVEQLGDFAVIIKSRIKVVALEQNPVRREFLGRIKTAFDQEGIQIPSPDFRKK
jgi:moderate conductance mechanosensitive channel